MEESQSKNELKVHKIKDSIARLSKVVECDESQY